MYAGYALTSITAYNLLAYSTVSHDESISSAISVVGSTGSAEGERRLRILNISAQKPDGTGSGTFLAQTVAAQVAAGHLTAVVCGIDDGDATDALPAQALVFPVRFNTSELPFHVCGMSDEMPYAATRYRDLTPQMVGQFESAFAAWLDRVAAGEAAVGITYIDNTLDDILADGTLEVVYPKEGMPYIPDGVAAFANADDVEDAKLFIEWLFSSDDNLKALADIDKKTTLLLALPTVSGLTLDFDTSQLMDEDLSKFGSEREATLAKWDEVTTGKEVVSSK